MHLERELEVRLVEEQLLNVGVDPVGGASIHDLDRGRIAKPPSDRAECPSPRPEQIETVRQGV